VARCKKVKKLIYLDSSGMLLKRERAKMEKHLESCPECRKAWKEAQAVAVNISGDALFPSEKEINWDFFMDSVYEKIHARLEEEEREIPLSQAYLSKRRLALLAPIAIVLVLGFLFVFIGFQEEPAGYIPPQGISFSEDMQRRLQLEMAKQATVDYLREGREVLLNLAGNPIPCNGEKIDITAEKGRIEKILQKKNYISGFLHEPELQRAASLCGEVETLLLDASSMKGCTNRRELQDLEETILGRNLLMKIEVITGELGYEDKTKQTI
jgi:hypothetical protein